MKFPNFFMESDYKKSQLPTSLYQLLLAGEDLALLEGLPWVLMQSLFESLLFSSCSSYLLHWNFKLFLWGSYWVFVSAVILIFASLWYNLSRKEINKCDFYWTQHTPTLNSICRKVHWIQEKTVPHKYERAAIGNIMTAVLFLTWPQSQHWRKNSKVIYKCTFGLRPVPSADSTHLPASSNQHGDITTLPVQLVVFRCTKPECLTFPIESSSLIRNTTCDMSEWVRLGLGDYVNCRFKAKGCCRLILKRLAFWSMPYCTADQLSQLPSNYIKWSPQQILLDSPETSCVLSDLQDRHLCYCEELWSMHAYQARIPFSEMLQQFPASWLWYVWLPLVTGHGLSVKKQG